MLSKDISSSVAIEQDEGENLRSKAKLGNCIVKLRFPVDPVDPAWAGEIHISLAVHHDGPRVNG